MTRKKHERDGCLGHDSDNESDESSDSESVESSDCESDESSDCEYDVSTFRFELLDCLSDVNSSGSFSAYQHSALFPNPGLHIKGLGTIPLPLSEHDAKAIETRSIRAPFGKGDETLVDTTVRKTWELNSSDFEFQNPSWGPYFEKLIDRAVAGLGVEVQVRADSYKLLLYEQGAFFKPHKDSEKVPGMFGTLVVCLPSMHEGGEVHLSHNGKKKVLTTASTSQFDISAFAWYSDVTHEIKPVTSGHRLVLTYNLVDKYHKTATQSANALVEKRMHLERVLQTWRKSFPDQEKYVYILEHQYTESSLHLQNLKGKDRALGQHLYNICASNDFHLFFAQVERTEPAGDEDDGDEEESTSLNHIVTPDGLEVSRLQYIELDEILQEDPFDRDADSEDEGEYTGNENMPGSLRYRNTVSTFLSNPCLSQNEMAYVLRILAVPCLLILSN
jgi:hypothetical protein